jgi:formate dehydrogenase maturation protein FdhE
MSDVTGLRPGNILGEAAKPPFAVIPNPASLFFNRSNRFAALAPGHQLAPYLSFLAALTRAQHEIERGQRRLPCRPSSVSVRPWNTVWHRWRRRSLSPIP